MYAAGGKTAVFKKVEIVYTEIADERERLKSIAEILSEGVYAYLRQNELLRLDSGQTEKVRGILLKAREIVDQAEGEIEGQSLEKTLDLQEEYVYNYGSIADHPWRKENVEKDND
jgi:protein involved in temperature-dependent protein secretion